MYFIVSPAHSEKLLIPMEYLLGGESCFNIKKIGKDVKKSLLYVGSTVGS